MEHEELEVYGDPGIESRHGGKIPVALKVLYISLPIWGIIAWFLYWNGAHGWLDRGYWFELEKAANTTYPRKNQNESPKIQRK